MSDVFNMELRVAQFRQVREKLEQLEEEAAKIRKPFQDIKDKLEGLIIKQLKDTGQTSARTAAGTASLSTKYKATLSDKTAFMAFVTENKLFDLIDKKANSTAVKDYLEEHKALPPGCNISSHTTVNVRRPTKSSTKEVEQPQESEDE